jgi:hypothetical protein
MGNPRYMGEDMFIMLRVRRQEAALDEDRDVV